MLSPMSTWVILRIVKLLAVGLFAAGAVGAGFATHQRDRITAAFWCAGPAFIVTWIAGFAMMKSAGHSLAAPWIGLVMFTSLMGFHHSVLAARKPERRAPFAGLASGWLVGSIVAMTIRDVAGSLFWPLVLGLGGLAGIGAWRAARRLEVSRPGIAGELRAPTLTWFRWMGRLEGLSFISLIALVVFRKTTGTDLDPWRLTGMAHGALYLVYLQALFSATRVAGWGRRGLGWGMLAGLVPFGPFVFEHKLVPDTAVPGS